MKELWPLLTLGLLEAIIIFFNLFQINVSFLYALKTSSFLFFSSGYRKRIRAWNGWSITKKDEKILTWHFSILDQGRNGLSTEYGDFPAFCLRVEMKGPEKAVIWNILWHFLFCRMKFCKIVSVNLLEKEYFQSFTQQTCTRSKSTIETVKKGVKYVQS